MPVLEGKSDPDPDLDPDEVCFNQMGTVFSIPGVSARCRIKVNSCLVTNMLTQTKALSLPKGSRCGHFYLAPYSCCSVETEPTHAHLAQP